MKLKPIPANTVVHTPTEWEAKELLAILHENGWKWFEFCGEEDDITYWDRYEHKTCYNLKPRKLIDTEERDFYDDGGYTILTLAEFKSKYCEAEKPQPKFKVGDRVWAKLYQNQPPFLGTIASIRRDKDYEVDIDAFMGQINMQVWCCRVSDLEPHPEPETKPNEDMEAKDEAKDEAKEAKEKESGKIGNNPENSQLDLTQLLKGHEGKDFYSPCYGVVTLEKVDEELLSLTVRAKSNNKLHTLGYNGTHPAGYECMLYPSNEYRRAYTSEGAWMKWQQEQCRYKLDISYTTITDDMADCFTRNFGDIYFRTLANRDKCIEEIKAIIEKYSEK